MKRTARVAHSPKQKRSREAWHRIMASYEASGLTQKEFCSQNDVAPSSFAKWRQKLLGDCGSDGQHLEKSLFMALPLQRMLPEAPSWDIELDLGNGMALRLRKA